MNSLPLGSTLVCVIVRNGRTTPFPNAIVRLPFSRPGFFAARCNLGQSFTKSGNAAPRVDRLVMASGEVGSYRLIGGYAPLLLFNRLFSLLL